MRPDFRCWEANPKRMMRHFGSTYICEQVFSILNWKKKQMKTPQWPGPFWVVPERLRSVGSKRPRGALAADSRSPGRRRGRPRRRRRRRPAAADGRGRRGRCRAAPAAPSAAASVPGRSGRRPRWTRSARNPRPAIGRAAPAGRSAGRRRRRRCRLRRSLLLLLHRFLGVLEHWPGPNGSAGRRLKRAGRRAAPRRVGARRTPWPPWISPYLHDQWEDANWLRSGSVFKKIIS